METLIHADIFFFVTTILVIVLAILVAVLVYYAIRISRSIFSITETVRKESEHVAEDIAAFRQKIKDDSDRMSGFGGFIRKVFMGGSIIRKAANRSKKKSEKAE